MKVESQLTDIKVESLMTRRVITVMANDSIQEVARIMMEHEISTLPVISNNEKCIGIISRTDLTELFLEEDEQLNRLLDTDRLSVAWFSQAAGASNVTAVKELMADNVSWISANAKITEACREMTRNRVHHLPVIDDQERLVGMLSTFDIVNAIAELPTKA